MAACWRRSEDFPRIPSRIFNYGHNLRSSLTNISSPLQVDTIVFATGYNYDFPYLPSNAMYKSGHRVGLYKHVFPPNLEHPTLAIVGFIHAFGAIMPQAEMQARWVTRVFKGEAACPPATCPDTFQSHQSIYFRLLSVCCSSGHKKLPSNQAMIKAVEKDTSDIQKT